MTKVLVLATTYPRWKDDTEPAFVHELTKRLNTKDMETVALVPHYPGAKFEEVLDGVKVYRFPYFWPYKYQRLCYGGGILPNLKKSHLAKIQVPFLVLSELYYAYKLIKKEKIDVIHAHWLVPQGFVAAILKIFFNVRLVTTIHGSDLFGRDGQIMQTIRNCVLSKSDSITVNSRLTLDELLKKRPECMDKVHIIPMGVDFDTFKKRKASYKLLKEYDNQKIILFVGRLSEQKGIQYLVESLPEVLSQIPDAKVLIIGEGSYKKELLNIIHLKKVEEKVLFLGAMSKKDLVDYYNLASVCVLPAANMEGQGITLIEAMICSAPVIATNEVGIKDDIQRHRGILIRPKNSKELAKAIIKLLSCNSSKKRLSLEDIESIKKKYSYDKISENFIKELEN